MIDLEALDDDLRALVRSEAEAPALSAERVARARERLELRLQLGAVASPVAAATGAAPDAGAMTSTVKSLGWAKLAGIAAVAFAAGAATSWGALGSTTASSPSTLAPAMAPPPPVTAASSPPGAEAALPPPIPSPPIDQNKTNYTNNTNLTNDQVAVDAVAAERTLLDQARRALREGDGSRALELIERHEREFRRGSLVEEREVLRVNALVSLGRIDEARARTNAFRNRFPTSPFLPALESQLRER